MDGGKLTAENARATIVDLSAAAETGKYTWIQQGPGHENVEKTLEKYGLHKSDVAKP